MKGDLGMNDSVHESLSVLMDGEASELEMRRVVLASESRTVRDAWSRLHTARAVLRGDAKVLAPDGLGERIICALNEEQRPGRVALIEWLRPLSGLAVAASVAVITVLGMRGFDAMTGAGLVSPEVAVVANQQSETVGRVYQSGQFRGIRNQAAYAHSGDLSVDVSSSRELSPGVIAARQRLQDYMFKHAEFSSLNSSRGMMPFARVAVIREK